MRDSHTDLVAQVKTELESLTSKATAAKQADSTDMPTGKGMGISHLAKIENTLRQEYVALTRHRSLCILMAS